ncbi:unnamed protein product, partial [Musa hybrid cultivar]
IAYHSETWKHSELERSPRQYRVQKGNGGTICSERWNPPPQERDAICNKLVPLLSSLTVDCDPSPLPPLATVKLCDMQEETNSNDLSILMKPVE